MEANAQSEKNQKVQKGIHQAEIKDPMSRPTKSPQKEQNL
jgi:hypothetical protein